MELAAVDHPGHRGQRLAVGLDDEEEGRLDTVRGGQVGVGRTLEGGQAPATTELREGPSQRVAPHGVDDDVEPLLTQVGARAVHADRPVRAELADETEMPLPLRRGHLRAERHRDLDREAAHPAGPAVHQHPVPRLSAGVHHEGQWLGTTCRFISALGARGAKSGAALTAARLGAPGKVGRAQPPSPRSDAPRWVRDVLARLDGGGERLARRSR